jgi:hypothetical protein
VRDFYINFSVPAPVGNGVVFLTVTLPFQGQQKDKRATLSGCPLVAFIDIVSLKNIGAAINDFAHLRHPRMGYSGCISSELLMEWLIYFSSIFSMIYTVKTPFSP